mgnify:CR=1 FL=1|jgi:uncharacterized protein
MNDLSYLKPVPLPNPDTEPYWDGLREGRLLLQRCSECRQIRHYPRPMCDVCYSMEHEWVAAAGGGKVHSWTETHHAFNPGFKGELPYVLVTVDLDEGVRINAQLRGAGLESMSIGRAVKIAFEAAKDDLVLPVVELA